LPYRPFRCRDGVIGTGAGFAAGGVVALGLPLPAAGIAGPEAGPEFGAPGAKLLGLLGLKGTRAPGNKLVGLGKNTLVGLGKKFVWLTNRFVFTIWLVSAIALVGGRLVIRTPPSPATTTGTVGGNCPVGTG